jgi:copper(I)-binding protein
MHCNQKRPIGPVALVTVTGLLGLLGGTRSLPAERAATLQITNAWIRWLPANLPSAGYMTLTNTGSLPRVLVGASSPDFAELSFHETRVEGGVSEMAAVNSISIRPQTSVRFTPGGYHIMLMSPKQSLRAGDKVPITLRFTDGQTLNALFEVRAAGATDAGPAAGKSGMPGMPDMPGMSGKPK